MSAEGCATSTSALRCVGPRPHLIIVCTPWWGRPAAACGAARALAPTRSSAPPRLHRPTATAPSPGHGALWGHLRAAIPARSTRRPAAPPFLHLRASPRPFTAAAIARHGFPPGLATPPVATTSTTSPPTSLPHYRDTAPSTREDGRALVPRAPTASLTISYRAPNRFCTSYSGHQAAATASNLQHSSPPSRAATRPSASQEHQRC